MAGQSIPFIPPIPTFLQDYNGVFFHEDVDGFVHVYTNGSCKANGKQDAAAGIGVYFGENHQLNVSEPIEGRQTSINSEIQAATRAITDAQRYGVKQLNIFTDSQFLIKSFRYWMERWKTNNWKRIDGLPVVNMEELKPLDKLIETGNMKIQWSYIPAHQGYIGNEMAHELAKSGAP